MHIDIWKSSRVGRGRDDCIDAAPPEATVDALTYLLCLARVRQKRRLNALLGNKHRSRTYCCSLPLHAVQEKRNGRVVSGWSPSASDSKIGWFLPGDVTDNVAENNAKHTSEFSRDENIDRG